MAYDWLSIEYIPFAINLTLAFIVLLVGSLTDLKTREVPDWVNFGLVIGGIGINLIFTSVSGSPHYIVNSIVGLAVFFGIAYIMFYSGQWGGGDSKMLMGLGALIGLDLSFKSPQFLAHFLVNVMLIGAIYGLLWSFSLAIKNRKKFVSEYKKFKSSNKKIKKYQNIILISFIALAVISFFLDDFYLKFILVGYGILVMFTFYLWVFVKVIEKTAMHKLVDPQQLTEGDWIVKDVSFKGEYICGPKDLGIEKSQIRRLIQLHKQGKIKKILIKEGIPFVPSFFIAFIVTFAFGNLAALALGTV